jgi:hypothetical protein
VSPLAIFPLDILTGLDAAFVYSFGLENSLDDIEDVACLAMKIFEMRNEAVGIVKKAMFDDVKDQINQQYLTVITNHQSLSEHLKLKSFGLDSSKPLKMKQVPDTY